MLKQLRIRFICITMSIVTVMMCIVFGMLLTFTHAGLEQESMMLMEAVAEDPTHTYRPNDTSAESRIPYFTLQVNNAGIMIISNGGSYDLSDQEFLRQLIRVVNSGDQTGVIRDYNLRYYQTRTLNSLLVVFADTTAEQNTMYSLIRTCICIGAASLLAFFFLSLLLARWAIHPVEQTWKIQKQFVADASHELKTPMTTIAGFAEGLLDGTIPKEDENKYLTIIADETRRLSRLVREMLDMSRMSDHVAAPENMKDFNLNEAIIATLLNFETRAEDKKLAVELHLPDDTLTVRGNEDAIRRVIYNLLDNAIKFAKEGGTLGVSLWQQGEKAYVSISDEGETIPPDDLPFIFDRFHKSDRSRSLDRDGVGLGLYLVKSILNAHDEDIAVTSKDGVTKFVFTMTLTK